MNINPNLKNPLALFTLCFLVIESIVMALLMSKGGDFVISPWVISMLAIFVVAFPVLVFVCFYILLFTKPEALFHPYENALANAVRNMTERELNEIQHEKALKYGTNAEQIDGERVNKNGDTKKSFVTEESILNQYIESYAPFIKKSVKVVLNGITRYFDGYASFNGCNYVVEVKRLPKWTEAAKQGVEAFASNARTMFSPLHMTIVLYVEDNIIPKDTIVKEIHSIAPAINIIFANTYEGSNAIRFSGIY